MFFIIVNICKLCLESLFSILEQHTYNQSSSEGRVIFELVTAVVLLNLPSLNKAQKETHKEDVDRIP